MTQVVRFVDAPSSMDEIVMLDYAVTSLSDDVHTSTFHQELPAVFSSSGWSGTQDYHRILDAAGTEYSVPSGLGGWPWIDAYNHRRFGTADGGWVALQNTAASAGVGVYYENRPTSFWARRHPTADSQGIQAASEFGLEARGTVRARAYLVFGGYERIKTRMAWLDEALGPFGTLEIPAEPDPSDTPVPVSGLLPLRGWTLDNKGVTDVEVLVDGLPAATLAYGPTATLSDTACALYPGYPGCCAACATPPCGSCPPPAGGAPVGFSGDLDTGSFSPCVHLLEVRARDTDGNERTIAARRIDVAP